MAKIANGILGLTAGVLALGAVQLEHARSGTLPSAAPSDASLRPLHDVDRNSKSDRLDMREARETAETLFVYPVAMPNTLIAARMVRRPATPAVAPARKAPVEKKSNTEARIGCEPLMSVLVADADKLPPGRCLV